MMGAFGRPLFVVHRHGCADMVRKAANTGTALALQGAHALLSSRAPRFYRMLTAALQAADTTLRRPQ